MFAETDSESLLPEGHSTFEVWEAHPWWKERASSSIFSLAGLSKLFNRFVAFRRLLIFCSVVLFLTILAVIPKARHQSQTIVLNSTVGPNEDFDLSSPPRYQSLKSFQENLPQHNLSLPFPEGETGRYVKFSSQADGLGWNNILSEL